MNAYDLVNKWVKEEKRTFFSDNEFNDTEGKIALTILQQYYNAYYEPSDDYHYCGTWHIENPYHPKVKAYKLRYCFIGGSKWDVACLINLKRSPQWQKIVASEILRLESGCKDSQEYIENFIEKNFYYVGKERFWDVVETEMYE